MQAQRRVVAERPVTSNALPAERAPSRVAQGLDDRGVHAVAVGRADAFRYGWDAGRSSRRFGERLISWLATLVGLQRVTPFADERLETLRLFACMMRRGERGLDDLAARLLAAGYSPAALHQATNLALS